MEKGQLEGSHKVHQYVLNNSLRESDLLERLRLETAKNPAAIMQIPPEQGQLMALLTKLISAKRAIEIGVFTGYSSICVAQAMPEDGQLVACDINEDWVDIARKYWAEAGVEHKIDLRIAPANQTLQLLLDEGQAETFDFVFIDADKGSYDEYYELSLALLRPGGLIAIDNTLLYGAVAEPTPPADYQDGHFPPSEIDVVKQLNLKIKQDERVDLSMLQMADGVTLVYKRAEAKHG